MTDDRTSKSLYWIALAPGLAAALAGLRWLVQGSGNVYTQLEKSHYLPDPDVGWQLAKTGPMWIGLEVLGGLAAAAIGAVAVAFAVRWYERKKDKEFGRLRKALFGASLLPLVVPVYAFVTGTLPDGAVEEIPSGVISAPSEGIKASLEGLPPGTYAASDVKGVGAVAKLKAGGETFDARFSGITGSFRGNFGDLVQPLTAEVSLQSKSVDTGIEGRSNHAREFLKVDEFERIHFRLVGLTAVSAGENNEIVFSADGELELLGKKHELPVVGKVRVLDDAGKKRLGLGPGPAAVVNAEFSFRIDETAIKAEDSTFDDKTVPMTVSLVLTHQEKP